MIILAVDLVNYI